MTSAWKFIAACLDPLRVEAHATRKVVAQALKSSCGYVAIVALIAGCGSGSPGGSSIGFLPQTDNVWAVVVDVTPSVEVGNESDSVNNPDADSQPGPMVGHELDQAATLHEDGYKTDYFMISGSPAPSMHVDKLPRSLGELGDQPKPISDYASCLTELIDRYHDLKKDQKVKLTIFGDFRYASGSQNYRNWTPTPDKFGGRRIDGWDVTLVYPNYASGSGPAIEKRADDWKKCLEGMGAASVTMGTTAK